MTSWCSPPRTRSTWSAVTVAALRDGRVRQVTTLLGPALRRRSGGGGQSDAQLGPRGDPQLWESAVQVRADGAMREVEPLPDLAVREALCRELGDLQLLCGQLVARLRDATPASLAGGAQLASRLLPPRHAAKGVEAVARGAQNGA